MKKLLFLAVLFLIGSATYAQKFEATLVSALGNAVDTVDNTETVYLTLGTAASATAKGYFKSGVVVFKAQEISGTGGGTATLQVSANGTDYANVPVDTAYTIVDQTAAQTYAWKIEDWYGKTFRIKVTGSGTMSYKVWGSAYLKN